MAVEGVVNVPWTPIIAALLLGLVTLAGLRRLNAAKPAAEASAAVVSKPPKAPAELKKLTSAELAEYDGVKRPEIYIAVKDPMGDDITIFEMTSMASFYGPEGPYGLFAGKHASCGLAKSSLDEKDTVGDVAKLSVAELDTLQGWHTKFAGKYPIVGVLVD